MNFPIVVYFDGEKCEFDDALKTAWKEKKKSTNCEGCSAECSCIPRIAEPPRYVIFEASYAKYYETQPKMERKLFQMKMNMNDIASDEVILLYLIYHVN